MRQWVTERENPHYIFQKLERRREQERKEIQDLKSRYLYSFILFPRLQNPDKLAQKIQRHFSKQLLQKRADKRRLSSRKMKERNKEFYSKMRNSIQNIWLPKPKPKVNHNRMIIRKMEKTGLFKKRKMSQGLVFYNYNFIIFITTKN